MSKFSRAPLVTDKGTRAMLDQISEGDAIASEILSPLHDTSDVNIESVCASLADMNIRGEQITVAVEMCCDGSLDNFLKRVAERDTSLVVFLNEFEPRFSNKAVVSRGNEQL